MAIPTTTCMTGHSKSRTRSRYLSRKRSHTHEQLYATSTMLAEQTTFRKSKAMLMSPLQLDVTSGHLVLPRLPATTTIGVNISAATIGYMPVGDWKIASQKIVQSYLANGQHHFVQVT